MVMLTTKATAVTSDDPLQTEYIAVTSDGQVTN